MQKAVGLSVAAVSLVFFLLNANFYPQLLTYQGGNVLASATKGKVDPEQVYMWKVHTSSSYFFYTKTVWKPVADTAFANGKKAWLLFDSKDEAAILAAGYTLGKRFETPDYEITKLDIKFINPEKRESQCTKLVLAEAGK